MFLFKKKKLSKDGKPKAIVFVDFEHWYISLEKLYHQKPDIRKWRDALAENYQIEEIYFFADFSNPSIEKEVPKIREVTNFIIETGNKSQYHKKDFTDFIMLDRIYQTAFNREDIKNYIIFSGDGHFSSVVRFLTAKKQAVVGIYGIKDAVSQQLKNSATWLKEIPTEDDIINYHYRAILGNLSFLENDVKNGKIHHPTFRATVDSVTRYYKLEYITVRVAMQELIDKEYVKQEEVNLGDKIIKELKVDWDKVINDGIWSESDK